MMQQHAASAGIGLVLAVCCAADPCGARESSGGERPWASEHVGGLPADIRQAVDRHAQACGNAIAAGHYFSTSISVGGQQFRSLHFEELACRNRATICRADGCLHEIYIRTDGHFRRVFSAYADDLRMGADGEALVIDVSGGPLSGTYRWSGLRFVSGGRNQR
jgi:hypothetical protein